MCILARHCDTCALVQGANNKLEKERIELRIPSWRERAHARGHCSLAISALMISGGCEREREREWALYTFMRLCKEQRGAFDAC